MNPAAIAAPALGVVALACLLVAAIADVRRFEIPDSLSIGLLASAAGYGLFTPGFAWLSHGAAVLLMFGIGLALFARGWMGGGDIKLLVAAAGWTGLGGMVAQLSYVAIAGGALAFVLIIARRALASRTAETLPRVFQRDAPLPYAIAIAAGSAVWAWLAWPVR